jgi:hypothetical protein
MMDKHHDVQKGDRFKATGGLLTVTRASRTGWVDIVVVQANGATWSKRMALGIPAEWERLPR